MPTLFSSPWERALEAITAAEEEFGPLPDVHHRIARRIAHHRHVHPVGLEELAEYVGMDARGLKSAVRELRWRWLLPVGSRRSQPSGYYWIHDADEARAWAGEYLSQAREEFRLVRRLFARAFPSLAGQLTLAPEDDADGGDV